MNRLLTVKEASELLGVPTTWLAREARLNRVPAIRLGRYVRFDLSALEEWTRERATGPHTIRRDYGAPTSATRADDPRLTERASPDGCARKRQ
jgi:excisionase family DNA binding protein